MSARQRGKDRGIITAAEAADLNQAWADLLGDLDTLEVVLDSMSRLVKSMYRRARQLRDDLEPAS